MELIVRCLQLPVWTHVGLSLLIFLFAGVAFWVLFLIINALCCREGVAKKLVHYLKWPTFVIFLEVAAIISTNIFGYRGIAFVEQTIIILLIATLGWVLANLIRAFHAYALDKYDTTELGEIQKRAVVTQVHLLYRVVLFLIIILTFAVILLTFPPIKSVGIGILGSAGILGIALGVAAKPILLNIMAGVQIAFTKIIKLEDAVIVEGDFARIEKIYLTHVVARTWDLRRIILPISYFIDTPFQNWSAKTTELIGVAYLYCDYSVPVEAIREKFIEVLKFSDLWNGRLSKVQVTDLTEQTMQLRLIMTAEDAPTAFDLRCVVREKMMEFLQKEYPHSLPHVRYETLPS